MFDWNDARYFLAVSRFGSLSRAARRLQVQQSTVGRRLAALEESLETRLFERTSAGYVLTPAGSAFVPHAEHIEAEALAAERRLMKREDGIAGTVRVTAPQAFGFRFLVPILARLHKEQPELLVELIAENLNLNLWRREADLALRLGRPEQRQLVMRKVGALVDALYVSRGYLARAGAVRADRLSGHTFVDFDEAWIRRATPAWLARELGGARCVLKVNGTLGIHAAVREGLGIGLLPCWLASGDEELVRVLPERQMANGLWLVVHKDLRQAARIRAVSDFFVRELARAAPLLGGRRNFVQRPAQRPSRR